MAYTKHGHHIPGTEMDGQPEQVARCGGVIICSQCALESNRYLFSEHFQEQMDEQFTTYLRRPFTVRAVRVTIENIHELSLLIGELREPPGEEPFIRVDKKKVPNVYNVHIGYWVTKMGPQVRAFNHDVFMQQFTEYTEEMSTFFVAHDLLDNTYAAQTRS